MSGGSDLGVSPQSGASPDAQAGGKDRGAPRIGNHPVVGASADNQPSQAVAERRVGSTSLWQRIVQIFTRRTAPQPAPAPAPSPAAAPAPARPESSIAPAARPVVGNPIIIAADPPSPDAAAAGYKTMSVIVGKTPQRVYARNERTLYEIQGILSQPGLLSDDEMREEAQRAAMGANLQKLGFDRLKATCMVWDLVSGLTHAFGGLEGNEKQRQEALRNSIERNRAVAGSFQSCQPPDKARIAGANLLVEMNSLVQTVETCAARCAGVSGKKAGRKQVAARKQVIEKLLDICNNPEYRVVVLERCMEGNLMTSTRTYDRLAQGFIDILNKVSRDPETREITATRLQELAKEYGPDFVERMVKTVYETDYKCRPALKDAYEEYRALPERGKLSFEKPSIDFDRLVLNDELRKIRDELNKTREFIENNSKLPEDEKKAALEQCQQNMERKFQAWLETHTQKEADGSFTIDVGHIKIMVNEEQLKHVTLKSLNSL